MFKLLHEESNELDIGEPSSSHFCKWKLYPCVKLVCKNSMLYFRNKSLTIYKLVILIFPKLLAKS